MTASPIYETSGIIIPLADVQHIEKHYYRRDGVNRAADSAPEFNGLMVIMKFSRWNFEHDTWDNNAWICREDADEFIKAWKAYREEVDRKVWT